MGISNKIFRAGIFLVTVFITQAQADVLELNNGDVIHGAYQSSEAEVLVFIADNFGELHIAHDKIKNLKIDQGIKVQNTKVDVVADGELNCDIDEYSAELVELRCGWQHYQLASADVKPALQEENLTAIAPRWQSQGDLSVAGSIERGNTHKDEWDASLNYAVQKANHRNRFLLKYENDINEEGNYDEEFNFTYNYDWFITDKWFLNANTAWKKDDSANLDEDIRAGFGPGYQVINRENHRLEVEAGYAYVKQNFIEDDPNFGSGKNYDALAWRLDWWFKPIDQIRLFHNHQLLQSLDHKTDYELETATGIRLFFNSRLYTELKYELDVKGEPLIDNGREDETLSVSLGFEW